MNTPDIENINVTSFAPMPTPAELHAKLPLSESAFETVSRAAKRCATSSTARTNACSSSSARAPSTTPSPASITRAA